MVEAHLFYSEVHKCPSKLTRCGIQYREIGKVIGGTKGNAILNYVSGAPNKETVIEEAPNVFDYDELTKYGFGVS